MHRDDVLADVQAESAQGAGRVAQWVERRNEKARRYVDEGSSPR